MSEICKSDFFTGAPPRAIGTECEYWLQPKYHYAQDLQENYYPEYLKQVLQSKNVAEMTAWEVAEYKGGLWLSNGARIYPDMNSCLEYCTPEAIGPFAAAAADIEGQHLMQTLTRQSIETEIRSGLFRRIGNIARQDDEVKEPPADQTGYTTNGYHQNLITPLKFENDPQSLSILDTYATTRIWAWSGMVGISGFLLSQKASGIGTPFSNNKADVSLLQEGKKPIGLLRDKEYDNPKTSIDNWSRVEIRYADAVKSPWSIFMNLATASLVLRMIEHRNDYPEIFDSLPIQVDPIPAINVTNNQFMMYRKLALAHGDDSTAIEIQEQFAIAAQDLSQNINLPADEVVAIREWLAVCRDLKAVQSGEANYRILADRVEWAARKAYLEQRIGILSVNSGDDSRAVMHDILWDHCNPASRSDRYWRQVKNSISVELQKSAQTKQFKLTPRAKSRADIIEQSVPGAIKYIHWDEITRGGVTLSAPNPYTSFKWDNNS